MSRKKAETLDMLTAAFLVGQKMKQTEIASVLGLSQAAVSRLVAEARRDYLVQEVRFLKEKVSPATMREILNRAQRKQLGAKLNKLSEHYAGRRGPVLRVFPVTSAGATHAERMMEFARHAMPHVKDLILRSRTCGVTWGGMLSSLVEAFRKSGSPGTWGHPERPIDFVPLCGEPLGDLPTRYSSSSLVSELAGMFNGEDHVPRSIAMVPAFIPVGFDPSELAGVKKLIGMVNSHREIFGTDAGASRSSPDLLANTLDSIITSVGAEDQPLRHGRGTLYETGRVTIEQLRGLIRGEIGGACIPRDGLTGNRKKMLEQLNTRWTGLHREHLEKCARRASVEPDPFAGRPGVVVISVGADRAPIVYEAIKLGLINNLVVDDELEKQLEALVANDEFIKQSKEAEPGMA